jgi:hypothetical protein
MNHMRYSLLLLLTYTLLSCEPLDVELIRTDEDDKYNGNIVYISNNDVFLTDASFSYISRLTATPNEPKYLPTFHPSKEKITYLTADRSPVIIDTTGAILERLEEYTGVKDMGWSTDGETLFMVINLGLQFYGPPIAVPNITFPIGVISPEIHSVDINQRNELVYTYSYYGGLNYKHAMVITSLDDGFETQETSGLYQERFASRFSNDGNVITFAIENRESMIHYLGSSVFSAELRSLPGFTFLYRSNDENERMVYANSNSITSYSFLSFEYTQKLEELNNFGETIELDYQ